MDKLIDFVFVKNIIPHSVCDDIITNIISDSSWQKHQYASDNTPVIKFPPTDFEILDSSRDQSLLLIPFVEKTISEYNQYINQHYSFGTYNSQTNVKTCTPVRFNKCIQHSIIEPHHDQIYELLGPGDRSTPILSIVGLLNDNFSGGEFVLFKDTNMNLKKGDIIIFPSNYLYPHRVDKINSGIRHSFVTWAF